MLCRSYPFAAAAAGGGGAGAGEVRASTSRVSLDHVKIQ